MAKSTEPMNLARCTAQRRGGEFCDAPSVPDAPFPICARHARVAYEFGASLIQRAEGTVDVAERLVLVERSMDKPKAVGTPCIYFVELGGLIKIGYTANWGQRKLAYPPHAKILHIHRTPEARRLEPQLHRKFRAHLQAGQEWFRPAQEITDFIDSLKMVTA